MKYQSISFKKIRLLISLILAFAFIISSCPKVNAMTTLYSPRYHSMTFTDMNGKTRDIRKFKTKSTILIFGRSSCSLSRDMLSSASSIKKSGVKTTVVFFGIDSYDSGLYSLKSQYPNVIFVRASTTNNSNMWSMLRKCGCTYNNITLPATFVLNKYGLIKYYSTGYDYSLSSKVRYGEFNEKIKLSKDNVRVYFSGRKVHNDCILYKKGKARKPEATVYLTGTNGYGYLEKGKDYTITYKNNKRIGKAKVIIRGKGAFKGKITARFTICSNKLKKNKKFTLDNNKYTVIKGGKSGKINLKLVANKNKSLSYIYCPTDFYYKAKICKVTKIGKNAYLNNTNAMTAAIGSNITEIETGAYQGCSNLKSVYIYSKKLNKIGANAFAGLPANVTVYVNGPEAYRQKVFTSMKAAGLPATATLSTYVEYY